MPAGLVQDGDFRFTRGQNSYSDPESLAPETYTFSVNMLNRGGALQTRPGYDCCFTLPEGKFQSIAFFQPRTGFPQMLCVVGGKVYVSSFPFKTYSQVGGATLDPSAKQVFTCQVSQSVELNPDNSLKLIQPRNLMMLQDGLSPATYYDGSVITALTGANVTPQGTHMAWVGNRLWTVRKEKVFAGDYANPLSNYEQTFNTLGGIQYFSLPGEGTGLALTPGSELPQLLAFTDSTSTLFRADIRNRGLWLNTPDFQWTMLPSIGNIASRSIEEQEGMLWWLSARGVTRLDAALFTKRSSKFPVMDLEMIRSKSNLHSDLSGVASVAFENLFLMSVPNASRYNTHTWVLDQSVLDSVNQSSPQGWAGVWTGVRPAQWAKLKFGGRTRVFCASVDADGKNRVYEAFNTNLRDNGCDIPWAMETRLYNGQTKAPKHLRYLEYSLSELAGQVDLKIGWAGVGRGSWKTIASRSFQAHEGNVDASRVYDSDSTLFALKKQSRFGRTEDVKSKPADPLSSAGVEGPIYSTKIESEACDIAFQFRLEGSGPAAIRSLHAFMDPENPTQSGQPDSVEKDEHFVRFDGAASKEEAALDAEPVSFTSTKSAQARYGNFAITATATITSTVSQADADKRATQIAQSRAEFKLSEIAPKHVGATS